MNKKYFDIAFDCADKALKCDEVPVGAVIVKNNEIISCGYNQKESTNNVTSHAEIIAIIEAEKVLNNWRLEDCDIYVTLDPCPMCASAIKQSRIKNIYSALSNSDDNNFNIISNIFNADNCNGSVNFETNLCCGKSKKLLSTFFKNKRL